MTSFLGRPWNSILSIFNPDAVDCEARAQAGFEGLCLVCWVVIPIRFATMATLIPFSSGYFKCAAVVLAACYLFLSRVLSRHWLQPAAIKGVTPQRQHPWLREQLHFCLWGVAVFFVNYHATDDSLMRERIFWRNLVPLLFLEASLLHLSRSLYFTVVLPVNLLACAWHFHFSEEAASRAFWMLAMLSVTLSYTFTYKHLVVTGLQRAIASATEAYEAAELQRQQADAWQGAFRAMLHGVFDASCVCDAGGVVRSSTPHLEQLLLGGSETEGDLRGGLSGVRLLDAALNTTEQRRFAEFLADVARPGSMRKIQITLRTLSKGGRGSCVEVTISGISVGVNADGSPKGATSEASQLFLGLQVLESVEPIGVEAVSGAPDEVLESIREAGEAAAAMQAVDDGRDEVASSACETFVPLPRGPSCRSAPAVLKRHRDLTLEAGFATSCAGENGDCLPPDAVVWLEGQSVPVKVEQVEAGQRVLCYDHLAGGLKYSEVLDVATHDASSSEWVAVILQDGTELQMTVDHPVFTKMAEAPIKAGDLEPVTHSLEVLRVVAMPVREVRTRTRGDASGSPPTERVSLSVQQPMRHSVFVASGPRAESSMAVASASVEVKGAAGNQYRIKNTFLEEIEEGSESSSPVRRPRAGSAPPTAWSSDAGQPSRRSTRSRAASSRARSSRSASTGRASVTSYVSSAASRTTVEGSPSRRVVVSIDRPADRTMPKEEAQAALSGQAVLSQILAVKRLGLRSIGSLRHKEGQCCPCLMETRHRQTKCTLGQPCRLGLLCGRCHEDHDMKEFAAAQKDLRRKKRSKAAAE